MIPTIAGEPDLAQYMQVIPGVVFTGDQGGQLYIRGGSPIQNKVLLDGMIIYSPFHSIGLFSNERENDVDNLIAKHQPLTFSKKEIELGTIELKKLGINFPADRFVCLAVRDSGYQQKKVSSKLL